MFVEFRWRSGVIIRLRSRCYDTGRRCRLRWRHAVAVRPEEVSLTRQNCLPASTMSTARHRTGSVIDDPHQEGSDLRNRLRDVPVTWLFRNRPVPEKS
jgi:hypothetical protein